MKSLRHPEKYSGGIERFGSVVYSDAASNRPGERVKILLSWNGVMSMLDEMREWYYLSRPEGKMCSQAAMHDR